MKSRFTHPPTLVRRVKLDNMALVPANLPAYKEQWQSVANGLPPGGVLICLPARVGRKRNALESVAAQLRDKGHFVTTLPAERFAP